jgi:general secretion pathway protein N
LKANVPGIATLVAGVIIGTLAWLPLRSMLPESLAAASVEGSIWNGSLRGAETGGLAVGDIALAVQPLALLGGEVRLELEGPALQKQAIKGEAIIGSGVEGLSASLQPVDAALPAQRITTRALSLRFAGNQCVTASGQIEIITALATLSGGPRCAGDAALVDFASADGLVTMRARIDAGGIVSLGGA